MRYFIKLSYNGKAYHGWQNQPKEVSVQEVLEHALSTLLKTPISIMGAGRTDTGVHASQMFAHFDFNDQLNGENLIFKLNSFLPKDITIHNIFKVKDDAHTRFNALSRTYLYRINLQKNVFTFDNTFYVKQTLDVEKMNEAAKVLFDYKDFADLLLNDHIETELVSGIGRAYGVELNLAKKFGATDGHKYINGVLDGVARSARQVEISAEAASANKK